MRTWVCIAEIVLSEIDLITLIQGSDHPVSLHFPEGAYLKGLVCVKG